jgi:serine/threonine protein kinase
MKLLR